MEPSPNHMSNALQRVAVLERAIGESDTALRQALHRVDEAERATNRGSWEWDIHADRAVWSKGMYRLFGVDPSTFQNTNENFLALVNPEDRKRMMDAMTAALSSPGPFFQEYRLTTPDGTLRHLRGEGTVVPDAQGKARLMYGFVQDVTQAKKAEQSLQDFKARFMDVMAHDLNNVLTPMAMNIRLIGDELTQAGRGNSNTLDRLTRNMARLDDFLGLMLDACRLQSGQLSITKRPYDLVPQLRQAIEDLHMEAAAREIVVEARLPDSIIVPADRRRIDQVTSNLFSNALKFTPAGGTIRIGARTTPTTVRVWVQDTGRGIAPEDQPRLFQPFSRVGSTEQEKHTGSGLGLFICRGLIEAHDGSILCESPGAGKGTTFTFVLPIQERNGKTTPYVGP